MLKGLHRLDLLKATHIIGGPESVRGRHSRDRLESTHLPTESRWNRKLPWLGAACLEQHNTSAACSSLEAAFWACFPPVSAGFLVSQDRES